MYVYIYIFLWYLWYISYSIVVLSNDLRLQTLKAWRNADSALSLLRKTGRPKVVLPCTGPFPDGEVLGQGKISKEPLISHNFFHNGFVNIITTIPLPFYVTPSVSRGRSRLTVFFFPLFVTLIDLDKAAKVWTNYLVMPCVVEHF